MTVGLFDRWGQPVTPAEAEALGLFDDVRIGLHRNADDTVFVSTVHLVPSPGFAANGRPLLFETMVLERDEPSKSPPYTRATNLDEAAAQHRAACDAYDAHLALDDWPTAPPAEL